MDALAHLGINAKLLIAQVVNFAILLFVLKRYAYRPILKLLDERSAKIEKGLADAEQAALTLKETSAEEKRILSEARAEVRALMTATEESAKKRDADQLVLTEQKTNQLLEEARLKIEGERRKMLAEAREEVSLIVTLAVEKVLKEKIDVSKDAALIEKMIQ